ncbi:hypothetical protein Btru_069412 [Bulinus truncatus]|nr:hypothetical protein Btru_069412 [Bulinus truncatus]
MEAACAPIHQGNSYPESPNKAHITYINQNEAHKNHEAEIRLNSEQAKEVAIQADDFEIQGNSGLLPARKRYIPIKFSDYRVFAGGAEVDEKEDEDETDSTFNPQNSLAKKIVKKLSRGRGRPRKCAVKMEETPKQTESNRMTILKVPSGYKCSVCGRLFSLRGNAKAHLITHTDRRPFVCDFGGCGQSMRTKESLRRHQLSHMGIKMFECPECQKRFSCNASLQEHLACHSGAKPLTCEICGRKFRQVAVLKRHLVTHSTEKPFACGICGKKFAMKIYVLSHMKTHTGEKPYPCAACGKSFAHASDLNRHKIIHSGVKPYVCSFCPMSYSDASSRRRHERKHQKKHEGKKVHLDPSFSLHSHLQGNNCSEADNLFQEHVMDKSDVLASSNTLKVLSFCSNLVIAEMNVDNTGLARMNVDEIELSKLENTNLPDTNLKPKLTVESKTEVNVSKSQLINPHSIPIEDISSLQTGCQYRIVKLDLDKDNLSSASDFHNTCVTFVKEPDNTLTIIHQPSVSESNNQHWPVESSQSNLCDEPLLIGGNISKDLLGKIGDEPCSETSLPHPKSECFEVHNVTNHQEDVHNVTNHQQDEKCYSVPEQIVLNEKEIIPIFPSHPNVISKLSDYIYHPDLTSQDYYNWLSSFTGECKLLDMPLEKHMFQTISHVQKTLSDFMAQPSGVITDKNNFKVLLGITRDFSEIISRHLTLMYQNLS